ncbi:50S ribosomal protein L9 [Wenxinia saemankumensis]|uniref:Large ribosomal subunit protein bL9 n=1 Tax=Wenxinia saemankumensis TaxID=1447782 RepID=A0A1M6GLB5_9RHOB|nr:50S ribosomal protein L9 [Wenxinia saemankumensis]SHJ10732.1 LSU ribosomal protein L9P [Wenxinia saemankumensis]
MDVILLERVAKLGQMGEIVSVKEGYARNFLLPQGKALRANEANKARFEDQKAHLEAQNLETKKEAESLATRLDGETYVIIRQASDGGALYGSVTPRDVAEAAGGKGTTIDKRQIVLTGPIKELGLHKVTVNLHPEVDVQITVNVARSEEEAELQASGKSIQEAAAEEEAAAEYEIQNLFDDIGSAGQDEGTSVDDILDAVGGGRSRDDENRD